jgi:hypothetical protein
MRVSDYQRATNVCRFGTAGPSGADHLRAMALRDRKNVTKLPPARGTGCAAPAIACLMQRVCPGPTSFGR